MSDVSFADFDDKEVRDFLNQLEKRLKNIKDGSKQYTGLLSAIVYKDVIDHFQQEKGSEGPWQKWSKSYRLQMEENGKSGNKILQDTGQLRNNFKPSKVKKTTAGLLWFNDAKTKKGFPYAGAHEEGGSQLPKRDFMWLSGDALESISEKTLMFMLEKGI